jgi:hypothetical protein
MPELDGVSGDLEDELAQLSDQVGSLGVGINRY